MKSVSKDILVYICSYLKTRDKCMLLRALGRNFYYWGRTSVAIWPNLTANDEIVHDRQRTQIVKDIRFDFQYGRYTMFLWNRRAYVYQSDLQFVVVKHEFSMSARKRNRIILCEMPLPTICDDNMLSYFTQHFFSHLFDEFGAKLFFGVGINTPLEVEEEKMYTQNKELRYQLQYAYHTPSCDRQTYGYETDPWIDFKEQRARKFEKRYKAKQWGYF